jgi:hypothetical protein
MKVPFRLAIFFVSSILPFQNNLIAYSSPNPLETSYCLETVNVQELLSGIEEKTYQLATLMPWVLSENESREHYLEAYNNSLKELDESVTLLSSISSLNPGCFQLIKYSFENYSALLLETLKNLTNDETQLAYFEDSIQLFQLQPQVNLDDFLVETSVGGFIEENLGEDEMSSDLIHTLSQTSPDIICIRSVDKSVKLQHIKPRNRSKVLYRKKISQKGVDDLEIVLIRRSDRDPEFKGEIGIRGNGSDVKLYVEGEAKDKDGNYVKGDVETNRKGEYSYDVRVGKEPPKQK